jgi:hypothetical protein
VLSGKPGRWRRAEQLIRNRRLDKEWPGIAATILEGLDEILCVVRLGLPQGHAVLPGRPEPTLPSAGTRNLR